jgi:hypothetical protein
MVGGHELVGSMRIGLAGVTDIHVVEIRHGSIVAPAPPESGIEVP